MWPVISLIDSDELLVLLGFFFFSILHPQNLNGFNLIGRWEGWALPVESAKMTDAKAFIPPKIESFIFTAVLAVDSPPT